MPLKAKKGTAICRASNSVGAASADGPSTEHQKPSRLKTSEEVYNMIKTDPHFDPCHCNVIYHDRVLDKMMSLPAAEWQPISQGGDVPWHRVYKFDYHSHVFWDRSTRTFDMQLLQQLADVDPAAAAAASSSLSSRLQYQNSILARGATPDALPGRFRLASLSVLGDLRSCDLRSGDPRLSNVWSIDHRMPLICEQLQKLEADVILLQDCTSKVLAGLRQQPWVQDSYTLIYTRINPVGVITLVRSRVTSASQESVTEDINGLRVTVPVGSPAAAAAAEEHDSNGSSSSSSCKQISIWNIQMPLASQTGAGSSGSSRKGKVASSSSGSSSSKAINRTEQLDRICQLAWMDCNALQDGSDEVGDPQDLEDPHRDLDSQSDIDDDGKLTRATIRSATDNARPYRSNNTHSDFCIIAGDSKATKQHNRDMGPFTLDNGWTDAWTAAQQQQSTANAAISSSPQQLDDSSSSSNSGACTYCPAANPLAKQLSSSGMSSRYDRVLLYKDHVKATAASLFGNSKPVLSDHFGLLVTLEVPEAG